jgi:cytochrome o ubiquinol oxidase operon protein cyoD
MSFSEQGPGRVLADVAPGDEAAEAEDGHIDSLTGYMVGMALAVLLTIVSFFVAQTNLVWAPSIPVALCVLAVAQMGVHVAFFLHIGTGPDSVNNIMALFFGVLIVLLVIGGSLWIMDHLNHNMPSMSQMMQMQR